MRKSLFALAACAVCGGANATPFISEIFFNSPGADNGQEFVELMGTPFASADGLYALHIDGDNTSAGVVKAVVSFAGQSFGSNGVLMRRDTTQVLLPAPDPASSVFVLDFSPDLENGSQTWVLGTGTPPAVGTDLDTDNDGVFDNVASLANFTPIDSVGMMDNIDDTVTPDRNFNYATYFGGYNFGFPQGADALPYIPSSLYRVLNGSCQPLGWLAGQWLTGTVNPGPYLMDPVKYNFGFSNPPTIVQVGMLSPGSVNLCYSSSGLNGTVTLTDFVGNVAARTIDITIWDSERGSIVNTLTNVALDANGHYSVNPGVFPGIYDIQIKSSTFLSTFANDVSYGSNAIVNATLVNGDCDGDDEVGPGDFGVLSGAYGSVDGDPNWNVGADLDGDGEVGPSDFGILSGNYGQTGG